MQRKSRDNFHKSSITDNLEEAGFDGWLAKPITTKRLDSVVRGAFEKIIRSAAPVG